MGFIKPKGIIMCQKCGQLHGVDYVCSKPKGLQPVKSEFPRLVKKNEIHPEAPDPLQIAVKVWTKEILDLRPEQELLLRMELGDITLLRQVGGVQVILEMRGGQSFTLNHDQFAQILDHGLNGEPFDGWSILLALCSLSVLIFSFFVFFMH